MAAGFPSPAEQCLEPSLDLNEFLVKRPAATFFVRVQGDSMIGEGIQDGDLLVVDRLIIPASGELIFRSSNYELYGDMSRRFISILRSERLDVEQYSIDEAFFLPPNFDSKGLFDFGKHLRAKILRWIGLPCGIGFALTKALAKIANHIAKKSYNLPESFG